MKTNQQNLSQNKQNLSSGQYKSASKSSSQTTGASSANFKSMIGEIPGQVQEFGSTVADKVSHLSTTQKVVGGSLIALGAGWIAARQAGVDFGLGHEAGKAKRK